MGTSVKYEYISEFRIDIADFEHGWETISLIFNGVSVEFTASYIGGEPLSTLIEAVGALDSEYITGSNESLYYIDWISEPGRMKISLQRNLSDNQLSIEITESECLDDSMKRWNFVMNYSLFRQAVIDLAITSLNKYGICGFNHNWEVENDVLPIGTLLSILGTKTDFDKVDQSFRSNLAEEISILTSIIQQNDQ